MDKKERREKERKRAATTLLPLFCDKGEKKNV